MTLEKSVTPAFGAELGAWLSPLAIGGLNNAIPASAKRIAKYGKTLASFGGLSLGSLSFIFFGNYIDGI